MGGIGSGRLPNPETIVKREAQKQTPIADTGESLVIPNYSGVRKAGGTIKTHGYTNNSILYYENEELKESNANLNWDGTKLTAAKIVVVSDNSTNDSEYVPMVLHGTDATPPTASGFPIGTIYIQYTA